MFELQALRRMNRHELHLVGRAIHRIGVGKQRYMRQIMLERHFFAACGFELINALLEFGHIVEPLLTSLGAQHAIVAALVEHSRHHVTHRTPLELPTESLDECQKLLGFRALENLIVNGLLERLIQRALVYIGPLAQKCHASLTHVTFRHIRHARERQVVLIRHEPQIAQRVFHFAPAKERNPRIQCIGNFGLH